MELRAFRNGQTEFVLVLLLLSLSVILLAKWHRATTLVRSTSTTFQITIATTTCKPITFVLTKTSTKMAPTYRFAIFAPSNVHLSNMRRMLLMKLYLLTWKELEKHFPLLVDDNLFENLIE